MGSRIACHFAGIGIQTLLLDIAPTALNEAESAKKLTLDHPAVKNRIVNEALAAAIKSNPSPVYTKDAIKRIKTAMMERMYTLFMLPLVPFSHERGVAMYIL